MDNLQTETAKAVARLMSFSQITCQLLSYKLSQMNRCATFSGFKQIKTLTYFGQADD